jgi:hypothetical protein
MSFVRIGKQFINKRHIIKFEIVDCMHLKICSQKHNTNYYPQ